MCRTNSTKSIKELGANFLFEHLENINIPSGFNSFDKQFRGLKKGGLYVFASRPAMGKTAFALSMVLRMVKSESTQVLIFSLEMSSPQLFRRIMKVELELENVHTKNHQSLEKGNLIDMKGLERMYNYPIWINDENSISAELLIDKIEQLHRIHPLNVVLVDYIQLLSDCNGQEVPKRVLSLLSQFAFQKNIVIVVTSQLPREVEKSKDKIPNLNDLDSLGPFSEHAYGIGFLHRPEIYGILQSQNGMSTNGKAHLYYYKDQDPNAEIIEFNFDCSIGKYSDVNS